MLKISSIIEVTVEALSLGGKGEDHDYHSILALAMRNKSNQPKNLLAQRLLPSL
jgi:hypothetical protein